MPTLLDLPSELLYQIIDLIARSPYATLSQGKRYRPEHLRSRNVVCYPEAEVHLSAGPSLLLTCQRLHTETSMYIAKTPQKFELNIAIIDANWLWPTWEHVPLIDKAGLHQKLDVNISFCETENQRGEAHLDVLSAQETMLEVSRIVSRLLLQGPFGMASDQPLHGQKGRPRKNSPNLRFKLLTFKVDMKDRKHGTQTFSKEEIPFRRVGGLGHLDFEPLYVLDDEKSVRYMDELARLTKQALNHETHGLVIKERVDKMVFMMNDETTAETDIRNEAEKKRARELAEYKARLSQPAPLT